MCISSETVIYSESVAFVSFLSEALKYKVDSLTIVASFTGIFLTEEACSCHTVLKYCTSSQRA